MAKPVAERRVPQPGFSGGGGPDQRKGKDRTPMVSAGSDISTGPLSPARIDQPALHKHRFITRNGCSTFARM
jgi:hypothetical protein